MFQKQNNQKIDQKVVENDQKISTNYCRRIKTLNKDEKSVEKTKICVKKIQKIIWNIQKKMSEKKSSQKSIKNASFKALNSFLILNLSPISVNFPFVYNFTILLAE